MDSYNDILNRMKEEYFRLSNNKVQDLSDIDIRMRVLAGEIYKDEVNLEFIKNQMFAKTAIGEYLDLHASDRGLTRKESVKATGKVKFYITLPIEENIVIPKGTIVSTSGTKAYRFVTDEESVLPAGNTSVTVNCTAEEGGKDSNISAKQINVIVTTVNNIETVTNTQGFSGGADRESDEDLRKRILDTYISVSNGTNKAYYKKLAMSVSGVTDANVVPKVRGVGTVDVYIDTNKTTPSQSLVSKVQRLMDTERELNVDVKVFPAEKYGITLTFSVKLKDGYDYDTVKEKVISQLHKYINSLSIGESVLGTKLGAEIIGVEGVYDFRWASYANSSFSVPENSYASLETIYISEV